MLETTNGGVAPAFLIKPTQLLPTKFLPSALTPSKRPANNLSAFTTRMLHRHRDPSLRGSTTLLAISTHDAMDPPEVIVQNFRGSPLSPCALPATRGDIAPPTVAVASRFFLFY